MTHIIRYLRRFQYKLTYSYFDPAWLIMVTPEVPVINPNAYITINKNGGDSNG